MSVVGVAKLLGPGYAVALRLSVSRNRSALVESPWLVSAHRSFELALARVWRHKQATRIGRKSLSNRVSESYREQATDDVQASEQLGSQNPAVVDFDAMVSSGRVARGP